jgi:outer membrane receptor for ferrienterochelin and colicins
VKFLGVIFIVSFLIFPTGLVAQKIKVSDEDGKPVAQAFIVLRPLVGERQEALVTNNNGEAGVSRSALPALMVVSHVSFTTHYDTLQPNFLFHVVRLKAKDIGLEEVVVTSEYAPRIAGESIQPVQVINRVHIENSAATNLEDVLKQQSGMRVSNDQILGSGLTMNGLSGQHIKFLVDGVPVIGRLDGNIDISQINLNHVERIEVVNGPMASSYGTDASGGVINIITRQQAHGQWQSGINFFHESSGHYNADLMAGYNTGRSSVLLSGGRNFFEGWSRQDTGRWKEWKPKEQWFANAKYRWTGNNVVAGFQSNGFREVVSNKGTPRISPYFAYAFDEYYTTDRLTNQLHGSWIPFAGYMTNSTVSHSWYRRTKNTFRKDMVTLDENLVAGSGMQDTTELHTYNIRTSIGRAKQKGKPGFQAGFDVQIDQANGSRFTDGVKVLGDYAFFASGELRVSESIEARPGIRFSHNTDYKSPVIPSVMFRFAITSTTTARFSYGKGFRAPGIKERYLYFVDINHNIQGNENLKPEYSDNFFVQLNQLISKRKLKSEIALNGFFNDVRNAIVLAQPDPGESLYTYINLGKYSTHGTGVNLRVNYGNITWGAGFSYTGRYNIYADSGNFSRYIYSPDLNASLQYELGKTGLTASVFYKYNGKLPGYKLNDDNTISQFSNDYYQFLDAMLHKVFMNNRVVITAGMKNILNVTNINAVSQGTAHSSGANEMAVGTGRSWLVKMKLNVGRE